VERRAARTTATRCSSWLCSPWRWRGSGCAARRRRAAGLSLVALGAAALVVALAVDLPDTRGSGRLPESLAYENARARAGAGLRLEIAGGALLVVAGGLLAAGASGGRRPASGLSAGERQR